MCYKCVKKLEDMGLGGIPFKDIKPGKYYQCVQLDDEKDSAADVWKVYAMDVCKESRYVWITDGPEEHQRTQNDWYAYFDQEEDSVDQTFTAFRHTT